jgi:hypothetical protein
MDIIKLIMNLWDKTTFVGHLFILIISLLIIFTIIKPFMTDFLGLLKSIFIHIKKIFNIKSYKKPKTILNIVNNSILMLEICKIESKINYLDLGDKDRNKIFKDIIMVYLTIVKDEIYLLIKNDINKIDRDTFKRLVSEMLTKMTLRIDQQLKITLGKKIYNIVILDNKKGVKKCTTYNDSRTRILIEEFFDLDYIETNHGILGFILLSISTFLTILFTCIEKNFYKYNGDLTSIIKENDF